MSTALKRKASEVDPEGEGPTGYYDSKDRPIILADMTYTIDGAALEEYSRTQAASINAASSKETDPKSKMTEQEVIQRLLHCKRVLRHADGTATCTYSYVHSEIGQQLWKHGFLPNGGRVYPDFWPSATCLSNQTDEPREEVNVSQNRKLRNCALGRYYIELDDANAFHCYLMTLTKNKQVIELLGELTRDKSYRGRLAMYYFSDDSDKHKDAIKELFHSLSNDGFCKQWRRKHKVNGRTQDHPLVERMEKAMADVTEELAATEKGREAVAFIEARWPTKRKVIGKKVRFVARNAKLTWKSFLLQSLEFEGMCRKLAICKEYGVAVGPPLHDALFVDPNVDPELLKALCRKMSDAIAEHTGAKIDVEIKSLPAAPIENMFELSHNKDTFRDTDFRGNLDLDDDYSIAQSLEVYNAWLSRFFVSILKVKRPEIVEIVYYPGSDIIKRHISRTPDDTKRMYTRMEIITEREGKPVKLLEWYLEYNASRRTADRIQMWTALADEQANPDDLNLYGGLPYDARFRRELCGSEPPRVAFEDPFPAPFLDFEGVSPERREEASEPSWRDQEGLNFIFWHIRYILCHNDTRAFAYVMKWFAYIIQKRTKPTTILVFYGAQGVGKTALVGLNENGEGIIAKIYGGKDLYFQTESSIDHLLKDFNVSSANKLFCCLEEATPYKKGHRNNDQLAALISNRVMRVEPKGFDSQLVNDFRAFCCCTNNRDAFRISEGDRRHVLLEADDRFSLIAVAEGRCAKEHRMEYVEKLCAVTTDEVAYEFFKYCMQMDISDFRPQAIYETDLHREQQAQNKCAFKAFLDAARCGEYDICESYLTRKSASSVVLSSLDLLHHFKAYLDRSGLCSSVDNVKSLGWAVKKHPDMIAKREEGQKTEYTISLLPCKGR